MNKNIIIGINLGDFGSTGNIMRSTLEFANKKGPFDYLIIVPKSAGKKNTYAYKESNTFLDKIDRWIIHKSIGNPDGFFEHRATKRIIKKIKTTSKSYDHIIIHLHNIHMASIDLRILFKFLAKFKPIDKIFYTIHDCWPFTGGCYCYNFVGCHNWIYGCKCSCIQKYGTNKLNVSKMWSLKKKYTLLLKNKATLIAVSDWILNELRASFLKEFDIVRIYGGTKIKRLNFVDTKLKINLGISNQNVILTISSYWNDWKGQKYIYLLAEKLPINYIIIVVGGSFKTFDYKNIIHVKDVSHDVLSHYFSIADVYLSTSQNESLGLTTCEAQICGVPVVAFGHTAIKETFNSKTGFCVGEENNIEKMLNAIELIVEKKPFDVAEIIKNGEKFDIDNCSKEYLNLYNKVIFKN
mgnify:CR=1 FL=1